MIQIKVLSKLVLLRLNVDVSYACSEYNRRYFACDKVHKMVCLVMLCKKWMAYSTA